MNKNLKKLYGKICEDAVCRLLRGAGLKIVRRNFVCRDRRVLGGVGEVDIIADDGEHLVFVEVKGREGGIHGVRGVTEVTDAQARRIINAADVFSTAYFRERGERVIRIDVAGVPLVRCKGGYTVDFDGIEYIENVYGFYELE